MRASVRPFEPLAVVTRAAGTTGMCLQILWHMTMTRDHDPVTPCVTQNSSPALPYLPHFDTPLKRAVAQQRSSCSWQDCYRTVTSTQHVNIYSCNSLTCTQNNTHRPMSHAWSPSRRAHVSCMVTFETYSSVSFYANRTRLATAMRAGSSADRLVLRILATTPFVLKMWCNRFITNPRLFSPLGRVFVNKSASLSCVLM